jgi:hypothetical protein
VKYKIFLLDLHNELDNEKYVSAMEEQLEDHTHNTGEESITHVKSK